VHKLRGIVTREQTQTNKMRYIGIHLPLGWGDIEYPSS
jgi:hypothetical protein